MSTAPRIASQYGGPGHVISDTGWQLLTWCGKRVTYLGAELDGQRWTESDHPGCFDCIPSPLIEWATGEFNL